MLLLVIGFIVFVSTDSKVEISRDGGYSNIVIKFDSDVNQHYCAQYIRRIEVRLQANLPLKYSWTKFEQYSKL